jgi:hypothetical protein
VSRIADSHSSASDENNATIILRRKQPLFSDEQVRFVIDCGDAVVRDAILLQKCSFPETAGNFCDPGNVVCFASIRTDSLTEYKPDQESARLLIGQKPEARHEPNAALIGKLGSRGSLTWTRPPGRMRLEIINVNGNQSVCAPLIVKAGRTYQITIHYGASVEFEIKEVADAKPKPVERSKAL